MKADLSTNPKCMYLYCISMYLIFISVDRKKYQFIHQSRLIISKVIEGIKSYSLFQLPTLLSY